MAEAHCPLALIDQLSAALIRKDLTVKVVGNLVTAKNPFAGLSQGVRLRETEAGLMWCWVWPGQRPAEPGAPTPDPTVEPFAPADQIDEAARLIANVVSGVDEPANA